MKSSRPFFVFYLLVGYIFVQFAWWGYHLIDLNEEIYALKIALAESQESEASPLELANKLSGRRTMVIGEGVVFLILLIVGAITTRKAFLREVELSNQQKNFLMSVSHELKSPLAAIKLNLQTLEKHDLNKAKSDGLLSASMKDADRLIGLVDNILIATEIESGDFPLRNDKLNLSNIISDTVLKIKAGSTKRLILSIDPDLFVDGDEQAMISITSNLVENALKYTSGDTPVSVTLKRVGEQVLLSVADEGKGIVASDEQKIFEKFYRAGDEVTRSTKGTGLGLFISQHLTERQNGTISVRSNEVKGSIFEVRFQAVSA